MVLPLETVLNRRHAWEDGFVALWLQNVIVDLIGVIAHHETLGVTGGSLEDSNLHIIGGDIEMVCIPGDYRISFRHEFHDLVKRRFANNPQNNPEVTHFLKCTSLQLDLGAFKQLRYHPLNQDPQGWLLFPYRAVTSFRYNQDMSDWRSDYRRINTRTLNLKQKVKHSELFNKIYGAKHYENNALGELEFFRDLVVHVNDPTQEGSSRTLGPLYQLERLAKELRNLFPEVMIEVFDFCMTMKIDMDFADEDED